MYGIGKKVMKYYLQSFNEFKSAKPIKESAYTDIFPIKYKTLVDIKKEWQRKIYPEKDFFQKNTNK